MHWLHKMLIHTKQANALFPFPSSVSTCMGVTGSKTSWEFPPSIIQRPNSRDKQCYNNKVDKTAFLQSCVFWPGSTVFKKQLDKLLENNPSKDTKIYIYQELSKAQTKGGWKRTRNWRYTLVCTAPVEHCPKLHVNLMHHL